MIQKKLISLQPLSTEREIWRQINRNWKGGSREKIKTKKSSKRFGSLKIRITFAAAKNERVHWSNEGKSGGEWWVRNTSLLVVNKVSLTTWTERKIKEKKFNFLLEVWKSFLTLPPRLKRTRFRRKD